MSKIGKEPIQFDTKIINVTIEKGGAFNNQIITVKGPKGELTQDIRTEVFVELADDTITVKRKGDSKVAKSYHGLYRSLIASMVIGVVDGYEKKLEIHGVGYRGAQKGEGIEMNLGYSHKVEYTSLFADIKITMVNDTLIVVSGVDKQHVGQVAAEIRNLRKPEPYKGKGIRFEGEQVKRKSGKSAS